MTGTVLAGGRYMTVTQLEEARWRLEQLRAGGENKLNVEQWFRDEGLEPRGHDYYLPPNVPVEALVELAEPWEFKFFWNQWNYIHRPPTGRSRRDRKLPFEEFKVQPLKKFRVVSYTTGWEQYDYTVTEQDCDESNIVRSFAGTPSVRYRETRKRHEDTFRAKNKETLGKQLAKTWGRGTRTVESIEEI